MGNSIGLSSFLRTVSNFLGFFSQIFNRLFGDKEIRILILGLDGAGKTTILYRLQLGEVITTVPSILRLVHLILMPNLAIGFNIETLTYKNLKFQVWDLGGM